MQIWGTHFTCIAPDTPGFGQSDPLPMSEPGIDDFADALAEFVAALGIKHLPAYGFHSGGIILVTALKRHPGLFTGLAIGGYAIWTPQEMAVFGDTYLPPFLPSAYGEHLTWLWNRILEQSWFFPWFDIRSEARLSVAHDDPARVHAVVMEMLDAGDAYRAGYGAVLRAPRDIPPPDAITPPVLITAYDGDPLQAHIDRLGEMPRRWEARKVRTPKDHQDASLAFLRALPTGNAVDLPEDRDAGFIHVQTGGFDGLIHWAGPGGGSLRLHAPGNEMQQAGPPDLVQIELPGHGLSDNWQGEPPVTWPAWQAVIEEAAGQLGARDITYPEAEAGEAERLYPDLSPDRFGSYLTMAWAIVRARKLFAPWYRASAQHALDFDQGALTPERLATDCRALLRAVAAKHYHLALRTRERN